MGFGLADFVKVRDGTSSSSPGCPSASASGNPGGMETREKSGDSQNSASPAATWTRRFEGKTTFCRDTGVNLNIHVLASISLVMTELHFRLVLRPRTTDFSPAMPSQALKQVPTSSRPRQKTA
jgi:hypothetical protein